jgi:hypothetical protein
MRRTAILRLVQATSAAKPKQSADGKCLAAYQAIVSKFRGDRHSQAWCAVQDEAEEAYKANLPLMDSVEHVRAYVSAVAQGVVLGVFDGGQASKLLYAAQVALSTLHQSKPRRAAAPRAKASREAA